MGFKYWLGAAVFCGLWAVQGGAATATVPGGAPQDELPALVSPVGEFGGQDPAAAGDATVDDPLPILPGWLIERSIYIPYDKLRETFEKQQRGVFVPYEEFDRLWELARKALQPAAVESAPRSGLITATHSRAQATRTRIIVHSELTIEFLRNGWHEVPLNLAEQALQSATMDGEPARLVPGANGSSVLLYHVAAAPATKTLQLEYAQVVTSAGGEFQAVLAIPLSGINRWQVSVEERDVSITIAPAAVITSDAVSAPDSPVTTVSAIIGSVPQITVRWTPRAVGADRLAAIVTAESDAVFAVQKNLVRLSQRAALNVQRAAIDSLALRVPAGFDVVGVSGSFIKRWERDAGDAQRLNLEFFEEIRGSHELNLELEMPLDASAAAVELSLGGVEILGASRQPGTVAVAADAGMGVELSRSMGLVRTQTEGGSNGRRFAFSYSNVPYALVLSAAELTPRVRGTQSLDARVEPATLSTEAVFLLDIQQAGIFSIPLAIPDEWEVVQVTGFALGDYQPVVVDTTAAQAGDGMTHSVLLSRQALGPVGLRVSLRQPIAITASLEDDAASEITSRWPTLGEGFAEYVTGQLRLSVSDSLAIRSVERGDLQPLDASEYRLLGTSATGAGALTFQFIQSPSAVVLSIAPRRPQVMVDAVTMWSFEPGTVRQRGALHVEVKYSPISHLRVDVPQAMAAGWRVESPGWRATRLAPQPDQVRAGHEAWLLQGGKELLGSHVVQYSWDQPLPEISIGQSHSVTIEDLHVPGVDRSRGQIVALRSELFDLQIEDGASGLRPIDPTLDLFGGGRSDNAVAALEYVGDWSLRLRASRLELHELKRTSIPRSLVRAVWLRQGQLSVQAVYQVSGVQQRLRLVMPPGFDPAVGFDQSPVRVDGQSVAIERGAANDIVISLGNRDRDQIVTVEVRYTLSSIDNRIIVPTFPEDCAVQKTVLCVYLPPEWVPVAAGGPWSDTYGEDRVSLFDRVFSLRRQTDDQHLTWIQTENAPAEELNKFETDGRLYVFSTMQPPGDDSGALRLTLVRRDVWNLAILGGILVVGLILLTCSWTVRAVAAGILMAALIAAMTLTPMATEPLTVQWLGSTLLVVGALWVVAAGIRAGGQLKRSVVSRMQRPAARSNTADVPTTPPTEAAATPGEPPPNAAGQAEPPAAEEGRS